MEPSGSCPFVQAYSDHTCAMADQAWPGVSWLGNGETGSSQWPSHYVGGMPNGTGLRSVHAGGNLMAPRQGPFGSVGLAEREVGDPKTQKNMGVGTVERQEATSTATDEDDDEPVILFETQLSSCSKCPFCKKPVGSRESAIRCVRRDIGRLESVKCPKCRFRGNPGESLRHHFLRRHSRLGQLPCRLCQGKTVYFWTKSEREDHELRAHKML